MSSSTIIDARALNTGCFYLYGGKLVLEGATVERCSAQLACVSCAAVLSVGGNTFGRRASEATATGGGDGPLLVITATDFKQAECECESPKPNHASWRASPL